MARPPDPVRRQELLDQVVRYLADHGLAGASLRPMAKALGVSLNGLVHHFGTKTDLLVAALARANELQQRESEGWLACNPALSQADLLRKWWRWINAAPEHLALVRLGLEAAALDATGGGLPGQVRAEQVGLWRTDIEQRLVAEGLSPGAAQVEASLVKAMFTGLVVDLIATGNRRRLTRALREGLHRLEAVVAAARAGAAEQRGGARPCSTGPALRVCRASPRTSHPSFWSADRTLEVQIADQNGSGRCPGHVHDGFGRAVTADGLDGAVEHVQRERSERGLERGPHRGADHPRDDTAGLDGGQQPRHHGRPDVATRERARRDRRGVGTAEVEVGRGQVPHGQVAIRAGPSGDLQHLGREVDAVDGGRPELGQATTDRTGAAPEVEDGSRRAGEVLDQQLGDAGAAGEPQPAEDVVVVRPRPRAVELGRLLRAGEGPGAGDRIAQLLGPHSLTGP